MISSGYRKSILLVSFGTTLLACLPGSAEVGSGTNAKALNVSMRAGGAFEIVQSPMLPPFPQAIELPIIYELSQNAKGGAAINLRVSAYIPGDTRSANQEIGSGYGCETSALEYNDRAIKLGVTHKWADAIAEYEKAVRAQPASKALARSLSVAELKYGEQLEQGGNARVAEQHYRAALYADRSNVAADKALDASLVKAGINRNSAKICRDLAEEFLRTGDLENAVVEYRKLASLVDSGRVHGTLGSILLKANKIADAYAELKIAVAKNDWQLDESPQLAQCHQNLGNILLENSDKSNVFKREPAGMECLLNAWLEYKTALVLDPTNSDTIKRLCKCSAEALVIEPSYNNWLAFGSASLLFDDLDQAEESYDTCERLDPNNPFSGQAKTALELVKESQKLASVLALQ